jgi:hypothetical protein
MCIRVSFCTAGVLTWEVFLVLYIREERERGRRGRELGEYGEYYPVSSAAGQ